MSKTTRGLAREEATPAANARFARVANAFARDPDVTAGKLFASPGLRVGGKIFAMLVRGRLVVKLPRERVNQLVDAGQGERFDPGHGRLMKEWLVATDRAPAWSSLAREAYRFVARGAGPRAHG